MPILFVVKLGKQLDSISQVAIVIYNECQYLSEEVLGLAYEVCKVTFSNIFHLYC